MEDNVVLKFILDEDVMEEILHRDYKAKIKKDPSVRQPTYHFSEKLSRSTCAIHESGLIYLNDYLAINIAGKNRKKKAVYKTADLEIISDDCIVKKNGKVIRIYPSTFYILEAFMRAPNGVVSRKLLMEILEMKNGKPIQDNTLNQHMNRTKALLGTFNGKPYIDTVYEVGYKWNFGIKKKSKK